MRFIPAEYVEIIYIVSYYMADKLGVTQEETAKVLGIAPKEFKDRFGISPAVDCKAYNTRYTYQLLIDERKEFLNHIIPLIGKVSSEISNSYFVSLSNDLSIVANMENNNKKVSDSMQMLYNITDNDDIYKWVFYEGLKEDVSSLKEKILNLIDTSDKEMTEEIFVNSLKWGIDIGQENLREGDLQKFKLRYEDFQVCIEKRDWFINARDDEDYDYADMFTVSQREFDRGKSINKKKFCDESISNLNRSISKCLDFFIRDIDFSSLDVLEVPFIEYLIQKYEDDLYLHQSEDLFTNTDTYCMKYFIYKFFKCNGVSQDSCDKFKEYMLSSGLREYVARYKNVVCQAFSNNEEVVSKSPIWCKFEELKAFLHSSKEKRCIRTALVYIDLDVFRFTDKEINDLVSIDENIYFVVVSTEKHNISLKETVEIIDDVKYYIYVSERTKENE